MGAYVCVLIESLEWNGASREEGKRRKPEQSIDKIIKQGQSLLLVVDNIMVSFLSYGSQALWLGNLSFYNWIVTLAQQGWD